MERYESYKDSGVEWIGEIPEGWETVRAKYVVSVGNGSDPTTSGEIPVYGSGGSFKTCGESKNGPAVLIGRKGTIDRPQWVDGLYWNVDTVFDVFPLSSELAIRYYYYLANCFDYARYSTQTAVPSMAQRDYNEMVLPCPELRAQHAIAAFLDAKTAEIDAAVTDVERSIGLLGEYRRSVISEAVTKGLDPDVPMKDSGVEWIGEVPEGWETSKIRYSFINRDSERVPIEASLRNQEEGGLYPYYGASGVVDYIDQYIFDEPLLLIGEDGANLRDRNLPLVYTASGKYWVNNHAHILQPDSMFDYAYAAYELELVDLTHYLTGSTMPKLTQDNLSKIPVVLPPLAEQRAIADHLDAKTAEIDALIADKRRQVDLLREYRKSLISEAVTGKFKVPGLE